MSANAGHCRRVSSQALRESVLGVHQKPRPWMVHGVGVPRKHHRRLPKKISFVRGIDETFQWRHVEYHWKPHRGSRRAPSRFLANEIEVQEKPLIFRSSRNAELAAWPRRERSFRIHRSKQESKFLALVLMLRHRSLSRIKFYYQLWEMDSSKIEIGKLIRASNNWSTQLNGREYISSKEKYIRSNIIINGLVERTYNHCCIWREVVTKGASKKWCRNKHISIHYWKGDLVAPLIIDQVVEKFNLLHPRS